MWPAFLGGRSGGHAAASTDAGLADSAAGARPGAARDRLAEALAGLGVAAALLTILLPPLLPAQDAPLYHLAIQILRTPERFARYIRTGVPLTGAGVQMLGGLLPAWLDPTSTLKLILCAGLAALIAGAREMAKLARSSAAFATCVASLLYVGWIYAAGFFNFLVGASLALWAGALWLRRPGRPAVAGAVTVLLAAATYVHTLATLLVVGQMASVALLVWGRRPWLRRVWIFVPAVAYAALVARLGEAATAELGWRAGRGDTWIPWRETLGASLDGAYAAYAPARAVVTACVALLVAGFGVQAARRWRGGADAERWRAALAVAGGASFAAALLAPLHRHGFYYVQQRFLFAAFAAPAMAALPLGAPRLVRLGACAALSLALLSGVAPARREGARLAAAAAELPSVPVGTAFVQIAGAEPRFFDAPYVQPGFHVHAYGQLAGGVSHFSFPGNAYINPLQPARPPGELFPPGAEYTMLTDGCVADPRCFNPARGARQLAVQALRWDTLLLPLSPASLVDAVAGLGWQALSPRAFRVGRGAIRVSLPALPVSPAGAPVLAEVRFAGLTGVIASGRLAARAGEPGAAVVLGPLPAAPLRLDVFVDADGDGKLSSGDTLLLAGAERLVSLAPDERKAVALAPDERRTVALPAPAAR